MAYMGVPILDLSEITVNSIFLLVNWFPFPFTSKSKL